MDALAPHVGADAMSGRGLRKGSAVLGALLGLALSQGGAAAQGAARSGFWLEGAWGAGTVRSACSACAAPTVAYGTSTHLRVGAALSPSALVGLEVFALHSTDLVLAEGGAPVDAENGSIAPVAIWYLGGSGLFLKGGVGVARGTFTVRAPSGEPVTAKRTGSAITFGIGYDVGVVRWLALTANLGMNITALGDVSLDDVFVDDLVATVYEAAVGIALR